jgi:hypothetical protein
MHKGFTWTFGWILVFHFEHEKMIRCFSEWSKTRRNKSEIEADGWDVRWRLQESIKTERSASVQWDKP